MVKIPVMLYKSLVIGVIVLFIGVGIQPSVAVYENAKKPLNIGQDIAIIDIAAWHFYRKTWLIGIAFDAIVKNVGTGPYNDVWCEFYGSISNILFPNINKSEYYTVSSVDLNPGETFKKWSAFAKFEILRWLPSLYIGTVEMHPRIDTNKTNNRYSEIFFIWGGAIFYDFGE